MRVRSPLIFVALRGFRHRGACCRLQFESGPQRTHLIELFTSEGCSSCPAGAKRGCPELKTSRDYGRISCRSRFMSIIGTVLAGADPFAAKEWTARQYRYSTIMEEQTASTRRASCLDGREWQERTVPVSSSEKRMACLKLSVANSKDVGRISIRPTAERKMSIFTWRCSGLI